VSLPHVLIGLLAESPASGWDLKRRLAEDPARGWDADLSQIYPALRRLLRGGFVSLKRRRSPDGPPRREYRVTGAGRRELREWLAEPSSLPRAHDAALVRLALLERSLPPVRLKRLQDYRALLAEELKRAAPPTTAARRRRRVLLETELAWADAESAALLAGRSLGGEAPR
jgi:PadR family transcriptional regulator AphA